ncbi:LysR family transcriptional regulator [Xaviernesmea oryzae]|uniref:HTH-type transcriptional regulator TtuA n=1 Tax=Xaviernesmea oryzae TaxID=464029 RepID=A0A1Q9ARJ8_9HYPH|nr:hydrogen peroxide-inducible genes activator [Xaviernesmea oryzae]OLP58062.1 LysR family transcriptional regulator [Xaviernesmea oryzae]SEL83988.1 LysR family transcriptional regulator, hydrogen peroxide-inducible genes activator [Xaviernesmea oryzae]
MITLRQMRYFEALATTGHFGRAAAAANISQPALSAQIMEMERHLGVRLVERGRSGVLVTAAGQDALIRVRRILAEVDGLKQVGESRSAPLEGTLRLGIIPTVAPYLVPRLLPDLQRAYPALHVELKETLTDRLLQALREGRLDSVIAALPIDEPGLKTRPLFRDRFFMAVAQEEARFLVSPMTQGELDVDRLLLLEEGHCLRDQALAVCGTGKRSLVDFGATSMATLLQMVAHNMGVTLIPEIAVSAETARNAIRVMPFAHPGPARELGLIFRASHGRPQDIDALAAVITTCVQPLLQG